MFVNGLVLQLDPQSVLDITLVAGVLVTNLIAWLAYKREPPIPTQTQKDLITLKKEYDQHVKDDAVQFDQVRDSLAAISVNTAVLVERISNLKEGIGIQFGKQTSELKKDMQDNTDELKENIKNARR